MKALAVDLEPAGILSLLSNGEKKLVYGKGIWLYSKSLSICQLWLARTCSEDSRNVASIYSPSTIMV